MNHFTVMSGATACIITIGIFGISRNHYHHYHHYSYPLIHLYSH